MAPSLFFKAMQRIIQSGIIINIINYYKCVNLITNVPCLNKQNDHFLMI